LVTTSREGRLLGAERRSLRRIAVPVFARLPAATRRSILHAFGKYGPWEDGFDPTPPSAEWDEVTGPPDFVGIGVQKAGTTWWYEAICAHPDVFTRADINKERHFFGRYVARPFGSEECALYHDWFPRPPGKLTGEWTPDYLHPPWVPPLLAQAAPRTRLLVLVRDPVERFRSALAHQRRDRGRHTIEANNDAVRRGFYHDDLRRWFAHFPREQILILQYERCAADPAGQLARTYRFLGLEPVEFQGLHSRVNSTAHTLGLGEDVRRRLVELYAPDVRALSKCFAEFDPSLWPNFTDGGRE
jgi:Sulfotransferase domain